MKYLFSFRIYVRPFPYLAMSILFTIYLGCLRHFCLKTMVVIKFVIPWNQSTGIPTQRRQ